MVQQAYWFHFDWTKVGGPAALYLLYREVQLDFTPEKEVLYMLFERCHIENRKRSIKQNIKYIHFQTNMQLDHYVLWHS